MAQQPKADQAPLQSTTSGGSSNSGLNHGHSFRPSLDGAGESLLHAGESVTRKAKSVWDGFSDFALRDNVLEVATGLM